MGIIKGKHLPSVRYINTKTGEVTKGPKPMMLGARPGVCQECAVDHKPDNPHNAQSLFYQYYFYNKNGRWPTWSDALAHVPKEIRTAWIEELSKRGITVGDGDGY